VVKELKTDEASVINKIESSLKKVVIRSDPLLHQEHLTFSKPNAAPKKTVREEANFSG
jgi:hypothetical protein